MHSTKTFVGVHLNVKLFMIKIVLNCKMAFSLYADRWTRPILQMLAEGARYGAGINYFVQDLCVLLLEWQDLECVKADTFDSISDRDLLGNALVTRILISLNHLTHIP